MTYPDGSTDTETFTVTIVEVPTLESTKVYNVRYPLAQATFDKRMTVARGTAKPEAYGKNTDLPSTTRYALVEGSENDHNGLWTFELRETKSGYVDAEVDGEALSERIKEERDRILDRECTPGEVTKEEAEKVVAAVEKLFDAGLNVNVDYSKGLRPTLNEPVTFELASRDGTPLKGNPD